MKKKKQRPRKSTKTKQKKVSKKAKTQTLTSSGTEIQASDGTGTETTPSELGKWLSERQLQLQELLTQRDTEGSGTATGEDFELVLLELGVPCSKSQLCVLTQKLKTSDNNKISYKDLASQLNQLRLTDGDAVDTQISEEDRQEAAKTQDVSSKESGSKERFIRLRVRMVPFDWPTHPGSFEVVLSIHRPVLSLMRIIQERVGIETSRLRVSRGSRRTAEDDHCLLSPFRTLEECGFGGGTETSPEEATVYYDYTLPRTDCPILNCDHYFTMKQSRTTPGSGLNA